LNQRELSEFLNLKEAEYNRPRFIPTDPIQIPHKFSDPLDIEISAFLTAVIAWGQRVTIINNAERLMQWMDHAPAQFIRDFEPRDLRPFETFVHRTFNGDDCLAFLYALQAIYDQYGSLEKALRNSFQTEPGEPGSGWNRFKTLFFQIEHLPRSRKHLPDPLKGSSAKRMNMFLRWMVRRDSKGVDFGIWDSFSPSELYLPLDVHTARVARKLGILRRKQNDWKAVLELTEKLRKLDPVDPVRFDFALFGLGAFEKY
jgi:uncharacterized protein (TIGR02757 family)